METIKESTGSIPPEKNSLLIGEVKKFPSLYDTSDPNYYVLAERNKAWLQVAANCVEPAELCHLRWKSLRKRYAKEKRKFPEILQGQRRPWALFPKMSFLTPATANRRIKSAKAKKKSHSNKNVSTERTTSFGQEHSDDDMLIVDDNDEIVQTCKSVEMSEEDEYIYETLDDPDSALELMKDRPAPKIKATAIRSGGPAISPTVPTTSQASVPCSVTKQSNDPITKVNTSTNCSRARVSSPVIRSGGSGRIRKLTPKMQNSIIAKKLKNAQQILQQSNTTNNNFIDKTKPQQNAVDTNNKTNSFKKQSMDKSVLYEDKTTRHVATVNPNTVRLEHSVENNSSVTNTSSNNIVASSLGVGNISDSKRPFKVVKVRGRNPVIFSPEQLPDLQLFLKSEKSPVKEQGNLSSPLIKVKSVDNLNNQNISQSSSENNDTNNLDIIHSVGLIRKQTPDKSAAPDKNVPGYSRSYSWNRPSVKQTTERIQPDSQTNGYEIEETWNDIKEENIDDTHWMDQPQEHHQEPLLPDTYEAQNRANIWNRVNEAKLELIAYQRKLLEDQHKKNLEYMKKEHDLKMALLKAEIDLKRKQLNIML